MDEFTLGKMQQSSLLVVYSDRADIQLEPDYQRIGGIWTLEKRQLLIDSLINGFDVPKLYFHEFVPPQKIRGKAYRYAIVDGKQRLQTIWEFIEGQIALSADFEYLKDPSLKIGGFDYPRLAEEYPLLKSRFDATTLDITTIRTDDIDLIEDMFSRLNEAVPLNAPEKRNAFGGPLPQTIKKVALNPFFTKHVPFTDNRYRHRDLATKFLYIEFKAEVVNTKKGDLDDFVRQFKQWRQGGAKKASPVSVNSLMKQTQATLRLMNLVFNQKDVLLRQVGIVTLYFHLFRYIKKGEVSSIRREMLTRFEKDREKNRQIAEARGENDKAVDFALLEFDKHSQTPNDAYALRIRLEILLNYLKERDGVRSSIVF